jgi:hypothetical protein
MQKNVNEWKNPDAQKTAPQKSQQDLVQELKKVLNDASRKYLQQIIEKYGNLKAIAEDAAKYILTFKDNMKWNIDKNSGKIAFASMSISIREAQMANSEEHKELLGTSQVYIHSSSYLNDIRKAVDVVNRMNPEAIKRISDIIEDNTIGSNTLGQYLHPVMTTPTPDQLKNVSGVIKLNIEAIKKDAESQTPEGFINKIADVIIHESEHKHDVETTGSSNESHPEQKEQEFQQKLEQSMPQQPTVSMSSRDIVVKTASDDLSDGSKKCDSCLGTGKKTSVDLDMGGKHRYHHSPVLPCRDCGGTGKEPIKKSASIKVAMPEFSGEMDELAKDKKGMKHFIKKVLPTEEPTEEELEMREFISGREASIDKDMALLRAIVDLAPTQAEKLKRAIMLAGSPLAPNNPQEQEIVLREHFGLSNGEIEDLREKGLL